MLFAIIFPLIFFRIGPRAVQLGSRFIRRGESSATATTDKKTPIELFNAFNPKVTKEFKGLIREVDRLNLSDRGDLEAIFISLTEAEEDLQKAVDTY
jgi:hypothetical protein